MWDGGEEVDGVGVEYAVGLIFFLKAEDGIGDKIVSGVKTCALPI